MDWPGQVECDCFEKVLRRDVLRRDNGDVLRRALDFEVAGRRGYGRQNMTWKKQAEEYTSQIGLKRENAIERVRWRIGVYKQSRSTR